MIRFVSFELIDFAVFRRARIELSLDQAERPLTVIRGENQSGKTTLMRAMSWALYGTAGIGPIQGEVHPIRSVCAPRGGQSKACVEIVFDWSADGARKRFCLTRSAFTRPSRVTSGFEVFDETLVLAELNANGLRTREQQDPAQRIKEIFPFEMKDFFFVDADKAEEYVGGSGQTNPVATRDAVTAAINNLLGLGDLISARRRVSALESAFMKQGSSDSSNQQKKELVRELGELENRAQTLSDACSRHEQDLQKATSTLSGVRKELGEALDGGSGLQVVRDTLKRTEKVRDELASEVAQLSSRLFDTMNSPEFFKELLAPIYTGITSRLDPMKDKGYIPVQELGICKRLLEHELCLCGARLDGSNPVGRSAVQSKLEAIPEISVKGARLLDQALELARIEATRSSSYQGVTRVGQLQSELCEVRERLADAECGYQDAVAAHKAAGGDRTKLLYDAEKVAQGDADKASKSLGETRVALAEVKSKLDGVQRKLRLEEKKEVKMTQASACAAICECISDSMGEAYAMLEQSRLEDVSGALNGIYRRVTNSSEDALDRKVGVRSCPADSRAGNWTPSYELYAIGQDGSEKALALLNGAARRTLGISFILSLAGALGEDLPIMADSLLHATSGETHARLLDYLTDGSRVTQPILIGTGQDFSDAQTRALIARRAGRTYTLTSQSQVGDRVVRPDPSRESPFETSVCDCGPSQYCDLCERIEWGESRMERRG